MGKTRRNVWILNFAFCITSLSQRCFLDRLEVNYRSLQVQDRAQLVVACLSQVSLRHLHRPATEQARAATDPALRAILERIARDEAEHAELAWRFVHWALRVGRQPVRVALAWELRPLRIAPSTAPQDAGLRARGRLPAAERQAIAESAWNDVILPCAEALGA